MATLINSYGKSIFDYYDRSSGGIYQARQVSRGLELWFADGRKEVVPFPDARELWNYMQDLAGVYNSSIIYFAAKNNLCYVDNSTCVGGTTTISTHISPTNSYMDTYYNQLYYQNRYYYGLDYGVKECDAPVPQEKTAKVDTSKKGSILKKLYWSYYQRHGVKPF